MHTEAIRSNRRILLIDDNESIHQDFRKILNPMTPGKSDLASAAAELFGAPDDQQADAEYEIDSAFQGDEGLEMVRRACAERRPYAMAFVDLRMPPGWDGVETIGRIWAEYPELQVVICTAYSDYSLGQIAAKLGRTDRMMILKKPFDAVEVLQFADSLTEKWRLAREAKAKMEDLEERVAERTRQLREEHQRLIEARKLELIGKLAGGVAHDFNTLLTAILGHAELITQVVPPDGMAHQSAGEITKAANCAATLTHQILAFSRRQMLKIEPLDVNAAITGMLPELKGLADGAAEIGFAANAGEAWTRTDAGQLRQVLVSIVHNACDAMPGGGKIGIETADVRLEDTPDAVAGDYVMIAVSDTGTGLSEDVKRHLFEPYFTTKTPTSGKGLNLAMCHGIIKQTGGHISVESELGHGATFKIFLPRINRPVAIESAPSPALALVAKPEQGTEVILMVEKERALRGLAASYLEKQGYTVHTAESSREAVSLAVPLPTVDLLIADSMLPEMTGRELAEWLGASHPHMKALFTVSADSETPDDMGSKCGTLPKPYTPAILSRKVRETLCGVEG